MAFTFNSIAAFMGLNGILEIERVNEMNSEWTQANASKIVLTEFYINVTQRFKHSDVLGHRISASSGSVRYD